MLCSASLPSRFAQARPRPSSFCHLASFRPSRLPAPLFPFFLSQSRVVFPPSVPTSTCTRALPWKSRGGIFSRHLPTSPPGACQLPPGRLSSSPSCPPPQFPSCYWVGRLSQAPLFRLEHPTDLGSATLIYRWTAAPPYGHFVLDSAQPSINQPRYHPQQIPPS